LRKGRGRKKITKNTHPSQKTAGGVAQGIVQTPKAPKNLRNRQKSPGYRMMEGDGLLPVV
jgi:hypothetical protein